MRRPDLGRRQWERRGSDKHRRWLKGWIWGKIKVESAEAVAQELADKIDKLEQDSLRDPLTGAFNRGFIRISLQKMIEQEREHGHGLGLMVLDLDHFKSINDEEPDHHRAGDRTLVALVKLLNEVCRQCTIGRWGGEEWLIVVPHASRRKMAATARKIGLRIKRHLAAEAGLVRKTVTASIGARLAGEKETAAEVMAAADNLCYRAKELGRARLVWETEEGKMKVVSFA